MDRNNKDNQIILDNVRRIMNDKLEEAGLNESMLVSMDMSEDFNDEIYLISKIIGMNSNRLVVTDLFKFIEESANHFINNYLGDYIIMDKLNDSIPSNMRQELYVLTL